MKSIIPVLATAFISCLVFIGDCYVIADRHAVTRQDHLTAWENWQRPIEFVHVGTRIFDKSVTTADALTWTTTDTPTPLLLFHPDGTITYEGFTQEEVARIFQKGFEAMRSESAQ